MNMIRKWKHHKTSVFEHQSLQNKMYRMIHNDFDNGRENMIFITITRWKLQSAGSLGLRTH